MYESSWKTNESLMAQSISKNLILEWCVGAHFDVIMECVQSERCFQGLCRWILQGIDWPSKKCGANMSLKRGKFNKTIWVAIDPKEEDLQGVLSAFWEEVERLDDREDLEGILRCMAWRV